MTEKNYNDRQVEALEKVADALEKTNELLMEIVKACLSPATIVVNNKSKYLRED